MKILSFANAFAATAATLIGLALGGPADAAAMPVFDGDADGVTDERDACLYSPRGIVVGPNGCSTPGDEDEDSIPDVADACPLSPAGSITDAQGCALDEDVDGVADGVDRCPVTRLGSLVDAQGCGPGQKPDASAPRRAAYVAVPVIRIPDPPPLPAPTAPVPTAPSGPAAPVSVSAPVAPPAVTLTAPPPATLPPAAIPAPAATPVAAAQFAIKPPANPEPALTLYFDGGEAELRSKSRRAIKDKADALRKELEQNALLTLVLSGHADTKSDGVNAPRLAAQRVTAVRRALLDAGVHAHRLSIRVPGVAEPRFEGDDLERNCRVELMMKGHAAVIAATPAAAAPVVPALVSATAVKRSVPVPIVAAPLPLPSAVAVAQTVSFAPYSALLDDRAIAALNAFTANLGDSPRKNPPVHVSLSGVIDGSEEGPASKRLAQSRAASVRAYLKTLGLPTNRVEIAADTASETRDGSGRRVDLRVLTR